MKLRTTTEEESKLLLSLGIDSATSDSWWSHGAYVNNGTPLLIRTRDKRISQINLCDDDIPAWSLNALLNLLPENIKISGNDNNYERRMIMCGTKITIFYEESVIRDWVESYLMPSKRVYEVSGNDLFSVIFEVIKKLYTDKL